MVGKRQGHRAALHAWDFPVLYEPEPNVRLHPADLPLWLTLLRSPGEGSAAEE